MKKTFIETDKRMKIKPHEYERGRLSTRRTRRNEREREREKNENKK